jgi:hypothetical protein
VKFQVFADSLHKFGLSYHSRILWARKLGRMRRVDKVLVGATLRNSANTWNFT